MFISVAWMKTSPAGKLGRECVSCGVPVPCHTLHEAALLTGGPECFVFVSCHLNRSVISWSVITMVLAIGFLCFTTTTTGILLFSRSLTPITATHHKHLSSARFFAVSYPSHMLLINCSLFLPLVHFPVILPSRMSRNNTSCRRTCPSHLRFRWFIVLMIHTMPKLKIYCITKEMLNMLSTASTM